MDDPRTLDLEMAALSLASAGSTSRRLRKPTDVAICLRLRALVRTVQVAIEEGDQRQLEVISGLLKQAIEGGRGAKP